MKSYSFNSYAFRNTAGVLTGIWPKTTAIALALSMTASSGQAPQKMTGVDKNISEISLIEPASAPEPATAVSARWALALFETLADNRHIPFKSYDGCFDRAEKMRRLLEKKGLKVMKIWAFGEPNRPLMFRGPTPNDIMLPWNYHVAVAIPIITANGEKKDYVIDPTIFDAPAEISEWAQRLNANPQLIRLTAPDKMPSEYYDLPVSLTHLYTKDAHTRVSIRHVYQAKLREELCSRDGDAAACKKRGQTWIAETPSLGIIKIVNYPQTFSMHF